MNGFMTSKISFGKGLKTSSAESLFAFEIAAPNQVFLFVDCVEGCVVEGRMVESCVVGCIEGGVVLLRGQWMVDDSVVEFIEWWKGLSC